MKKIILVVIVAVAIVIGVPAAVYAYDYVNEYEVDVGFTISSSELGVVSITDMTYSSRMMDWWSFWDTLKGHSAADRSDFYLVFVEITGGSGNSVTENQYVEVSVGTSKDLSYTLFEVKPGSSNLRIYVQSMLTQSIVLDQSYDVTIG